jgi:uncharacterized protein YndB with AHSA1/START domain
MSEGRPETEELVFEADLDAPPEKVWRAVATPEIREAWLGEAETGAAEVARSEPPSRLDLVWPTREGDTLISFEIAPREGGSHLTIVHRALAPAVVALHRRARPITARDAGWRMAA